MYRQPGRGRSRLSPQYRNQVGRRSSPIRLGRRKSPMEARKPGLRRSSSSLRSMRRRPLKSATMNRPFPGMRRSSSGSLGRRIPGVLPTRMGQAPRPFGRSGSSLSSGSSRSSGSLTSLQSRMALRPPSGLSRMRSVSSLSSLGSTRYWGKSDYNLRPRQGVQRSRSPFATATQRKSVGRRYTDRYR